MKEQYLIAKKRLLGFLFVAFYLTLKYGTSYVAYKIMKHYGITYGCLFLAVAHAITSYSQLRAYDKAQDVLKSTEWIHRIKNGDVTKWWHWNFWALFNADGRVMFIILATQLDPFVTTVYIRDTEILKWKPTIVFILAFIIGIIWQVSWILGLKELIFG
jgi:hypothetical protein